jgi:alpha-ketoglutarate-dependent taurine dioxygenase
MISTIAFPQFTPRAFHAALHERGYVYLDKIPDGFDHTGFCREMVGELMPQYDGGLEYLIRAEEQFQHLNHSLTTNPLNPHSDGYEFTGAPPRHIALWCLFPPSDNGGRTTLCDTYRFLETLGAEERQILASRRYRFVSGIEDTSIVRSALHPVVEDRDGAPTIVRYSLDFVEADDFLRDINQRLLRYYDDHHDAVAFETNAMLIFDNLRMVHGRTGYQDRRRQLRRIWLR